LRIKKQRKVPPSTPMERTKQERVSEKKGKGKRNTQESVFKGEC